MTEKKSPVFVIIREFDFYCPILTTEVTGCVVKVIWLKLTFFASSHPYELSEAKNHFLNFYSIISLLATIHATHFKQTNLYSKNMNLFLLIAVLITGWYLQLLLESLCNVTRKIIA